MANLNASSVTWQSYVDLKQDVKPWLQIPINNVQGDSRLQLLIDGTCQWAQRRIGQPIAPTTFLRRFDGWNGWNGAYIELPYYPILEVQQVIEYWGFSGPHYLSEQTPTNQVDGYQVVYELGRLTRAFPGLVQKPWFPGSRNIEVTWVSGYNPVPADIKMATLEMIAHWWRNTQQSARTVVRGGGDDADVVAAGLWQGTPLRITNILDALMQVGIA